MKHLHLLVVRSFVFLFVTGIIAGVSAQDVPSDKAVLAFALDQEKIRDSKTLNALTGGESLSQFVPIMGQAEVEVIDNLDRISGFFADPKNAFDPDALMATNMLVILEMKSEAVVKKMEAQMADGFVEAEMNGKKVLKADGVGAPPWFARVDGKRLIVASERYLFADPKSILSQEMKELLKGTDKSAGYLVANLDGAREMLTEVSKMANADADFMTKQYISLIDQVATVRLTADLDGNPLLNLKLRGHDEKENKQIKLKIDAAIGLLKGVSELGMVQLRKEQPDVAKLATELMEGLTVELKDSATVVNLKRPKDFTKQLGTTVNAAMKEAKAASKVAQDLNRMKQVALSKHNYYDTYRKFPFDPEHTKNVSWRVRVLPFVEESNLFDKFDLDQKWSSDKNKKLIGSLPDTFRFSNGAIASFIKPEKLPVTFLDVTDGTSNTIVFVENRNAKMTPWTKPEGVAPAEFVKMVKGLDDGDSLIVAFYDGRVDRISNKTSKETLLKLCNPSDGEIVEEDDIK